MRLDKMHDRLWWNDDASGEELWLFRAKQGHRGAGRIEPALRLSETGHVYSCLCPDGTDRPAKRWIPSRRFDARGEPARRAGYAIDPEIQPDAAQCGNDRHCRTGDCAACKP